MSGLYQVAIGIKTFLRDAQLFETIQAIQETMPEVMMIVADCGEMTEEKDGVYADLERQGHKTVVLPFDAGFGAMSNAIVNELIRPYLLIGSDDFDFRPRYVRHGIEQLVEVLDLNDSKSIASGRVNNRPYEFWLHEGGGTVIETPIDPVEPNAPIWYCECDLTVNYSLIHHRVFESVCWDEDVKIGGGEHGAFFVDCKRAGFHTVYVPGVNIYEQTLPSSDRYKKFRSRARSPERPCFDKRGITEYIMGNGVTDYKKEKVNG